MVQQRRQIRGSQALGQGNLVMEAEVAQATTVEAEAGGDVRPGTYRNLAEALGVKPRELMGE